MSTNKDPMKLALAALSANNQWHIDYDDTGSYAGSELQLQTQAAIDALVAAEANATSVGVKPEAQPLRKAVEILCSQAGENPDEFEKWLCDGGLAQMAMSHFAPGKPASVGVQQPDALELAHLRATEVAYQTLKAQLAAEKPSTASAAAQGEPVAWAVYDDGVLDFLHSSKSACDSWLQYKASREVRPLYLAPPPAAGREVPEWLKPFASDIESIEGCLEWSSREEQMVNVGPAIEAGIDVHVESSAGWVTRLLRAMLAAAPQPQEVKG